MSEQTADARAERKAEVDRILTEAAERDRKVQAKTRHEFAVKMVAEDLTIPDLVFEYPRCSVCDGYTSHDGDGFYCEGCSIGWPSNGYAEDGWIDDEGSFAVTLGYARRFEDVTHDWVRCRACRLRVVRGAEPYHDCDPADVRAAAEAPS